MDITDKSILITGATGGIGAAICKALDTRAVKSLVLVGRNDAKLDELAATLKSPCHKVVADMTSLEGRRHIAEACQDQAVDIVINTAGTLDFNLFSEQDPALVESMLNLNLLAPMALTNELLPILKQKNESLLLFVGSTFGSIGHPGFTAYCASKFGLRGFVEALRRELFDTGIIVHYLAPRATQTNLNSAQVNELNRALGNNSDSPELVAAAVLKLLKSNKGINRYLGWPEKFFVRLNSLLPGIVDGALAKKLHLVKSYTTKTS